MAYGESRSLLENQVLRYRLAGYKVKWQVLNARDFGVAQHRRRVFLVGIRSDLDIEYNFPEPTHGRGRRPTRFAARCHRASSPLAEGGV